MMHIRLLEKIFSKARVLFVISAFTSSALLAEQLEEFVFESRYAMIAVGAELSQTDLLANIVELSIPSQLNTVGESLDFILAPHGYTLANYPATNDHFLLLVLPLPESHRQLGPITLREAINVLGGDGFEPVINPVTRSIRYQLRDEFQRFVNSEDIELAKHSWLNRNKSAYESFDSAVYEKPENDQFYGPVRVGETLSGVVNQLNISALSVNQVLVLLFQANPHAFVTRNMNHLIEGVMLHVPDISSEKIVSHSEAKQIVDEHYRLWVEREQ